MSYDDFERLRQLVPDRADFHLNNWGLWRRRFRFGIGFRHESSGFSGGGMSSDFEDLCEDVDNASARIADAIIEGLAPRFGLGYTAASEARILRALNELHRAFVEARVVPVVPKYQTTGNIIGWPGRGRVQAVSPAALLQ